MATPSAINTLIDLAQKESDEAAKRLGEALRKHEEAEQKLELLKQYRDDYAQRCQSDLTSGISAAHFNNFQMFMHKLDQAIAGQQTIVNDTRIRSEQARSSWQSSEQKKMSYITLSNRADRENVRRELRRDQKQNDEHAARRSHDTKTQP